MKRSIFMKNLRFNSGIPLPVIKEVIDAYEEWIRHEVVTTHKCIIPNLGKIYVLKRKARMGHNPKDITQKCLQPESWTPKMKFAPRIKQELNDG